MPAGKIKSYFNAPIGTASKPQAIICGSIINKGAANGTISFGGGDNIIIAPGDSFTLPFIPGHVYQNFTWNATGTTLYVALIINDF